MGMGKADFVGFPSAVSWRDDMWFVEQAARQSLGVGTGDVVDLWKRFCVELQEHTRRDLERFQRAHQGGYDE